LLDDFRDETPLRRLLNHNCFTALVSSSCQEVADRFKGLDQLSFMAIPESSGEGVESNA
jgi:hypothetical protein